MHLLIRPAVRVIPNTRSFVSKVLLSRPLDQLTVADLKNEARSRGLSPTGKKANLLLRIQEHEKSISSTAASRQAEATASEAGAAPGIPPEHALSTSSRPERFHVIVPDASYDDPEPPVQIPYAPDFWTSSNNNVQEAVVDEPVLPKIVVVAGAETHTGGGPSHNLLDESTLSSEGAPEPQQRTERSTQHGKGGLLDDMTEDMGLPYPHEMKKAFWKLFS
ncbi:hypothetical protein AAF712_001224 [Marasmius tenuissimus]|uniref:SAP domain-containing protein n=1 Tax=Marasmius tenuissimus TaxID=585030 RepID=A0ABR3AFL4_9AGAR